MKIRNKKLINVLSICGRYLINLLGRSIDLKQVNIESAETYWNSGKYLIYATWHGRILMMPYFYHKMRNICVLTSLHRDGDYVSNIVSSYGMSVVRGSTRRSGSEALRKLLQVLKENKDVAIIPDGPRGPRYIVQPGIITLSKLAQVDILPVSFGASKKKR